MNNLIKKFYLCGILFFFFSGKACTLDSNYNDKMFFDNVKGNSFFQDSFFIETGAPLEDDVMIAADLRFNFATGNPAVYILYVSTEPFLPVVGREVLNTSKIVAFWHSLLPLKTGEAPGFLRYDSLFSYNEELRHETPFTFSAGKYYWTVLGFNDIGNLTHSSAQNSFTIAL